MKTNLHIACLEKAQTLEINDLKPISHGVGLGTMRATKSIRQQSLPVSQSLVKQNFSPKTEQPTIAPTVLHTPQKPIFSWLRFVFEGLLSVCIDGLVMACLGVVAWAQVLLIGVLSGVNHRELQQVAHGLWLNAEAWQLWAGGIGLYGFYQLVFWGIVGMPLSKILNPLRTSR